MGAITPWFKDEDGKMSLKSICPTTRVLKKSALAVLLAISIPAGASAEKALPATHTPSGEACLPAVPDLPDAVMFRELFLVPGRKLSLADIPPATMAKFAEVQRIEAERAKKDWPNLCKFLVKNRSVLASGQHPRVVFLGDSITENWEPADPSFFGGSSIDRGIGGQTTPQLLLRFYPDVVALRPRVVHIMAGTNDVAGNTGPVSDESIIDNIRAMIDIAEANDIRVVLASIPPASKFFWNPASKPAARIKVLNLRLRDLAAKRGAVWVDYHAKLTDAEGGLPDTLANDGVHPNRSGYAIMRPIAEAAIRRAERKVKRR